jgi:hypothetical protein
MTTNKNYQFKITYLERNTYRTYREIKNFNLLSEAKKHFNNLLDQFKIDGQSYYLCGFGVLNDNG